MEHPSKSKAAFLFELSFGTIAAGYLIIILLFGSDATSGKNALPDSFWILGLILSLLVGIAQFTFFITLGMLAKKIGRSWIAWVGLTLLTSPIGAIVAFFWMGNLVNEYGQPKS